MKQLHSWLARVGAFLTTLVGAGQGYLLLPGLAFLPPQEIGVLEPAKVSLVETFSPRDDLPVSQVTAALAKKRPGKFRYQRRGSVYHLVPRGPQVFRPILPPRVESRELSDVTIFDGLFEKYEGEFGVNQATLKKIARCESRFNPGAVSRSGLYGGMYQFLASTWRSTRQAMGLDDNPDLRFNAEEAVRTAAFKISRGGIGAWPVCGRK